MEPASVRLEGNKVISRGPGPSDLNLAARVFLLDNGKHYIRSRLCVWQYVGARTMNRALTLLAVCLLAGGLFGCTGAQDQDRSKDFPLTVLNSMFVPGILQSTIVEHSDSGKAFLALKVRMENKGTGTASPGAMGFKVIIDNERYPCDFLKHTDNDPRFDGEDFSALTIQPRSYVEGWMVFAVPLSVRTVNTGELRLADKALLGDGAYSKVVFSPSSAKSYETISERFTVEAKSMTITYKFTGMDKTVLTPSADNLFAVCDLAITNKGRTKVHLYLTSDNILFVSSQKTEYARGAYDSAPDTATPLKGQDIQPSGSARGTLIYEVPMEDSYINKVLVRYSASELYSYTIPKDRIDIEANGAPVAKITANDTGFMDTDIQFDAAASTDPDGDSLTYLWDFGDKGTGSDTSTSANATYKYAQPGSYAVSLKVKDIGGLENIAARTVKIIHYFSLKESGHGLEANASSYYDGAFYVDINLTNNQNRTRSIPSSLFRLKTSDGAFYDWVGDNDMDPTSLGPGASAAWRVYFTIPESKIPISIIFDETVTAVF